MLGEPMKNNFDALIDEINLVSTQKEQMKIAKSFETAEFLEDSMTRKTSPSLLKALDDIDALGRKYAKQAQKIRREDKIDRQVKVIQGFRTKLKGALMMKSITPQQAMALESKFNNLTARIGGLV